LLLGHPAVGQCLSLDQRSLQVKLVRKIRIQLNWHYTILHDDKVDAFHAFEGYFECTYDLSKQAFLILLNVVVQLCGDRQILIQL